MSAFRRLSDAEWQDEARRLAEGDATLVSLWADDGRVRMALREVHGALTLVETECEGDAFPSVAAVVR